MAACSLGAELDAVGQPATHTMNICGCAQGCDESRDRRRMPGRSSRAGRNARE